MIFQILEKIIQKGFYDCGYETDIQIILSNRPDLCDFQCDNAFKLAKLYHKSPLQIGQEVVEKIKSFEDFTTYFKEITCIAPGFINIIISDSIINHILNSMIENDHFDISMPSKRDTYVLDYGGPNIAKPLHVGHLRTAIIGESIKRIIEFMGHKTVSDVHFGDYGLQIGEVIYGMILDNKDIEDIDLAYLDETYPKMSKLCKENPEILAKCAEITKQLQEGNQKYQSMWKRILEISKLDIQRIYRYLGVNFDVWYGESDAYPYIDTVTKQLQEKHLLKESDHALVVEVKKEEDNKEIPPLIYQKSNGAYLYGTTDLATIYQRVKDYQPNHILYVTDLRQSLHFEQVFRVCEKWGITENISLEHLGYGTVNGKDGKPFKTRTGDAAKLDDLLNQVKEEFIKTKESNKNMKEEDLDKIVNAIIKFADLQNNREKDYIFDIEKFSNVVGKTGPYVLYTYVRMNKILQNETLSIGKFNSEIYNEYDRNTRIYLLQLEQAITSSFHERMPHYIAEYVYKLCECLNAFYQHNHIIGLENEKKQQWLLLIHFTNRVIKELLHLLVIEIPSEM